MFENVKKPAITVKHASLTNLSDESAYKKICPVCKVGVLFVARDQETFRLIRDDRCVHCGQAFVYSDHSINGEVLY